MLLMDTIGRVVRRHRRGLRAHEAPRPAPISLEERRRKELARKGIELGPDSEVIHAARYGFDDWSITFDPGAGAQNLKAYVSELNGLNIEAILEEVTAGGDTADAWAAVGLVSGGEFTISGPYNDATNGPDDLFAGNQGSSFDVVITWGSTKTSSFAALLKSYNRNAGRGQLTKYEATFRVTGAVTEA